MDQTFTRTDAAGARHLLTDGLGSTLGLTDANGSESTQYTYEPFGQTSTSGATSGNPSQFTGRENDGTGLYYYRARYYSPGLQRFISEDPLGFGGGDLDLYVYVENDPANFVDPSGLRMVLRFVPRNKLSALEGRQGSSQPGVITNPFLWSILKGQAEWGIYTPTPMMVVGPVKVAGAQTLKTIVEAPAAAKAADRLKGAMREGFEQIKNILSRGFGRKEPTPVNGRVKG